MDARTRQEKKFYTKELAPFDGGTVVAIIVQAEDGEVFTGLRIKCLDGKTRDAVALRDPEGNGPGHLAIGEI